MNRNDNPKDCETLRMVYLESPPPIPFGDMDSLFGTIKEERSGKYDVTVGQDGWQILIVPWPPTNREESLSLVIPYSPMFFSGMVKIVRGFFINAGVSPCC